MVASLAVCHSMSKSIIVWQFVQNKHFFLSDNKKSEYPHKSTLIIFCPTAPGNLSYQGRKLYFPRDNNSVDSRWSNSYPELPHKYVVYILCMKVSSISYVICLRGDTAVLCFNDVQE